jgi:hypothetical protein
VTSTAEPVRATGSPAWWRTILVVLLLAAFAMQTPQPWSALWLLIPAATAVSLLAAWRFGAGSVAVPVALFATALTLGGPAASWAWWIPVASLTGVWMGLREEGGGVSPGARAWMLLPLLLLAAGLPWTPGYADLVRGAQDALRVWHDEQLAVARQMRYPPEQIRSVEEVLRSFTDGGVAVMANALPTTLFVWVALLVRVGRMLAARTAASLRWPTLSRGGLSDWRLPDGALWLMMAGLALVVAGWRASAPTAWTLLLNTLLGFGVQGIAVVESLLLARGVSPSVTVLTLLFVLLFTMPVSLFTAVVLGLSDVWLDYRRLETAPHGDER